MLRRQQDDEDAVVMDFAEMPLSPTGFKEEWWISHDFTGSCKPRLDYKLEL